MSFGRWLIGRAPKRGRCGEPADFSDAGCKAQCDDQDDQDDDDAEDQTGDNFLVPGESLPAIACRGKVVTSKTAARQAKGRRLRLGSPA